MISRHALECLGHLANEQRFAIVKALIAAGENGLSLKHLERKLSVSRGVIRRNVRHLATCSLVRTHREDRSVVCTVNHKRITDVISFLTNELAPGLNLINAHDTDDSPAPQLFSSLRDRLEALDGLDISHDAPISSVSAEIEQLSEPGYQLGTRAVPRGPRRRAQRLRGRRTLSDALAGFGDDL